MAKKPNFKNLTVEEIINELGDKNGIYSKGLSIKSYEASDIDSGRIYKKKTKKDKKTNENKEIHYMDGKRAVISNSLFLVVLAQNGLRVYSDGSTDDVLYLDFKANVKNELGYLESAITGAKKDIKKFKKKFNVAKSDAMKDKYIIKLFNKYEYLEKLQNREYELTHDENGKKIPSKDLERITTKRDDLRTNWYLNGFDLERIDETGKVTQIDHYEYIFVNSSKARVGKTIWIRTSFKKVGASNETKCINIENVRDIMTMGLHKMLKKSTEVVDLVSLQAYSSLMESATTDGYIRINPKNILAIKDEEVKVQCVKAKVCTGKDVDEDWIPLKDKDGKDIESRNLRIWDEKDFNDINILWDGQSFLDESYFEDKNYSFMLLRQHMFKSACFKCKLKDYIKNWCEEHSKDYYSDTVTDMFGHKIKYCDIEMITTDSSLKFLKFKSLFNVDNIWDYWSSKVAEHENLFAIVKYDKPTKYDEGNMVRYSYQMINSLNCGENKTEITENLKKLCEPTVEYINKLRKDFGAFKDFMKTKLKNSSECKFWLFLIDLGIEVTDIKEFNDFWQESTNAIRTDATTGGLLLHGSNMTLCGNPVEMVLKALSDDEYDKSYNSFGYREYNIENPARAYVSKNRFEIGKKFVACRSPHVSEAGCMLFENVENAEIHKLFGEIGDNIMIVDLYEFPLESEGSGFDFDSDFVACSDNETLVKVVESNSWNQKAIPVCRVAKEGAVYHYNDEDMAKMSIRLSSNTIGEITNKSQLLVSQLQNAKLNNPARYNKCKDKVEEAIYKLVNSQGVSIDGAKNKFLVSLKDFLKIIDEDKDIWWKDKNGKKIYPLFFKDISQDKEGKKFIYMDCNIDIIKEGTYTKDGKEFKLLDIDSSHKENKGKLENLVKIKDSYINDKGEEVKFDPKKVNSKQIEKLVETFKLYHTEYFSKKNNDKDEDDDENFKIYGKIKFDCKEDIKNNFTIGIDTLHRIVCWCLKETDKEKELDSKYKIWAKDFRKMNMFVMEVLIDTNMQNMTKIFQGKR